MDDEQMNNRDHFAAAALAGLLAAPTDKDRSMDYWARLSYEAADAMLRGRERVAAAPVPYVESDEKSCFFNTKHDAVPAAIAQLPEGVHASVGGGSDRTDKAVTRPAVGAGESQEPVAWAVVYPNGEEAIICWSKADAEDMASASDRVVPLYRQPQPCPYVTGTVTRYCTLTPFTLTDAEREAVEWAAFEFDGVRPDNGRAAQRAATLRGLLERTK